MNWKLRQSRTALVAMVACLVFACTTTPSKKRQVAVKREDTCVLKSHELERAEVVERVIKALDRGQPQALRPYTACTLVIGPPRSEAESEYDRDKAVMALTKELSHYQWTPPFYGEGEQFLLTNQNPFVELIFTHLPGKGWFITGVAAKDLTLRRKLYGARFR